MGMAMIFLSTAISYLANAVLTFMSSAHCSCSKPDNNFRSQGTSLDPPSYDTRSLFSMFSATNTAGQGQKRLVDMDQLLNDANARLKVNDKPIHIASREERKEKMRKMGSHSR